MKGPALGKYANAFLLLANSFPNFDLKKMILTYAKEFSWKIFFLKKIIPDHQIFF
jgi:hypothetical protein